MLSLPPLQLDALRGDLLQVGTREQEVVGLERLAEVDDRLARTRLGAEVVIVGGERLRGAVAMRVEELEHYSGGIDPAGVGG
jgi:hypothetical protein